MQSACSVPLMKILSLLKKNSMYLKEGEKIKLGQEIAEVGSTRE